MNLYQRKTHINGSEVYFNMTLRKQHILTSLENKSTDWEAIAISVQIIVVPTKPITKIFQKFSKQALFLFTLLHSIILITSTNNPNNLTFEALKCSFLTSLCLVDKKKPVCVCVCWKIADHKEKTSYCQGTNLLQSITPKIWHSYYTCTMKHHLECNSKVNWNAAVLISTNKCHEDNLHKRYTTSNDQIQAPCPARFFLKIQNGWKCYCLSLCYVKTRTYAFFTILI